MRLARLRRPRPARYCLDMRVGRSTLAGASLLLLALGGCGSDAKPDPSSPSREPLVTLDDWVSVPRDLDPFIENGDDAPSCAEPTFRVEEEQAWVELDTTLCNWVTLEQTAHAQVAEDDLLELTFSHYDLDAAEPARAELELRFDGCSAWSKSIPIPSAAQVYTEQFRSPCRLTSASDVLFHLNNHGQNTYQLKDLVRVH